MPRKANFIFEVQIRISEAFTLDSIVRNPRTFKPKDVLSACQNNELVVKLGDPPPEVVSMATYVMTDFFAMAHATGLYNRQKHLWESLSQVNAVHVHQMSSGVFRKTAMPVFDFSFLDYKGKPLLYAGLITGIPDKQNALSLLKAFIGRAQGKPSLTGVLACFAAPFPKDVLDFVQKQTFTTDPIAKYESVLPAVKVPFDLLEMNSTNMMQLSQDGAEGAELRTVFTLLHPDLKKDKKSYSEPMKVMRKVTPKKKRKNADGEVITEDESSETSTVSAAAEPETGANP